MKKIISVVICSMVFSSIPIRAENFGNKLQLAQAEVKKTEDGKNISDLRDYTEWNSCRDKAILIRNTGIICTIEGLLISVIPFTQSGEKAGIQGMFIIGGIVSGIGGYFWIVGKKKLNNLEKEGREKLYLY